VKLVEGCTYRVAMPGACLERMKPLRAWAWASEVRPLALGEVITYDGARPGVGSDPIAETHWIAADGSRGWTFSPGTWGWPRAGALAEAGEHGATAARLSGGASGLP
jgi:hypothetical protein